jgi:hypothetical protein
MEPSIVIFIANYSTKSPFGREDSGKGEKGDEEESKKGDEGRENEKN